MHRITFEDGIKIDDENRPLRKGEKKHGTIVEFIPSAQYLGKDSDLPFDRVCDWLDDISYQITDGIKIRVDEMNGSTLISKHKYKAKPFAEYIKKMINENAELIGSEFSLSGDAELIEEVTDASFNGSTVKPKRRNVKKDIHLDVAFVYQDDLITSYNSFCNFTTTEDGGVHVDSVEEVLCRFLQAKTKENMTDKEREKWDITWGDVKEGLKVAINLSTDVQVDFMGNAKNRIQNENLKPVIKKIVQEKLEEMYAKSSSSFLPICRFIKANARARVEANKTRIASRRTSMGRLDRFDCDSYTACNNTGKQYKELYLAEGKRSGKGALVNSRYSTAFQAVFGFRGCTKNPYKVSFAELMQNLEWKEFVNVLQCGIGETFSLSKLIFDKIILCTDADIDGFYISMGICSFFGLYLPEVVEAGRLYKVFPPLYKLDDKNHEFIVNKRELTEIYLDKIASRYKVKSSLFEDFFKKDALSDFLFDTVNYVEIFDVILSDYYHINTNLIEIIAATLVESGYITSATKFTPMKKVFADQKFITLLMSRVQRIFPELRLNGQQISGPLNGKSFASIEINDRFPTKISPLIPIYQNYGYMLSVQKKKEQSSRNLTILDFLRETSTFLPNKIRRYKGVGEGHPDDIERTIMDPDKRILVRYTMDDCERALKTFHKLQGNKKADLLARKIMMEEYEIDPEDIDT